MPPAAVLQTHAPSGARPAAVRPAANMAGRPSNGKTRRTDVASHPHRNEKCPNSQT